MIRRILVSDIKYESIRDKGDYVEVSKLVPSYKELTAPEYPLQQVPVDVERCEVKKFRWLERHHTERCGVPSVIEIAMTKEVGDILGKPFEVIDNLSGHNNSLFYINRRLDKAIGACNSRPWYKTTWLMIRGKKLC